MPGSRWGPPSGGGCFQVWFWDQQPLGSGRAGPGSPIGTEQVPSRSHFSSPEALEWLRAGAPDPLLGVNASPVTCQLGDLGLLG